MRWPLPRHSRSPIGIDLGSRCIKAVQLSRADHGWSIAAAAVLEAPTLDAIQVARLADVLHRQGFKGSEVVLAAPAKSLRAEVLELPPRSSDAPIEQIARLELARMCKLEPSSFEMALWDLPAPARGAGATHAIAVATKHDEAQALLDLFESRGLSVRALDCQAWAMARACGAQTAAGITALLDLGWGGALLVLVHRGVVIYQRSLPDAGLGAIHQQIIESLGVDIEAADHLLRNVGLGGVEGEGAIDPARLRMIHGVVGRRVDALAAELDASFSYATHRYPDAAVERLLLVGGGAGVPGLRERLAGPLKMDVKTMSPAEAAHCPAELLAKCGSPALTLAAGLAMHTEG